MRTTRIGEGVYSQIVDLDGRQVIVRQSAVKPPSVWIFCRENGAQGSSLLLGKQQAKRIISALQKFVDGKP